MTSRHAYPPSGLLGDLGRAVLGLVVVVTPLIAVPLHPVLAGFLGILVLLFLTFAGRTAFRAVRHIEVTDDGIATTGPWPVALPWDRLDRLVLRYYATRRDRKGGWMQLSLRAGRRRLSIDSQIDGFSEIVARAARAALARHLPLDDVTRTNLGALDLDVGDLEAQDAGTEGVSDKRPNDRSPSDLAGARG
ncbi:MAG TPA: hypothetical protein VNT30_03310 [Stellaceae bacterium]|nr:hypothetical protein [Stellaceae bacterium]